MFWMKIQLWWTLHENTMWKFLILHYFHHKSTTGTWNTVFGIWLLLVAPVLFVRITRTHLAMKMKVDVIFDKLTKQVIRMLRMLLGTFQLYLFWLCWRWEWFHFSLFFTTYQPQNVKQIYKNKCAWKDCYCDGRYPKIQCWRFWCTLH